MYNTLKKFKSRLESLGYTVLYLGIYGSQNYNLDDKDSDIDAKAVVLPTFEQFARREKISKVIEFEEGQVDVKDIMTFDEQIRKGNVVYLETVWTKYSIGDKKLKEYWKTFPLNLRSVLGMMYQKLEALDHPYPSKLKQINLWGFDPKQFHHILRLSHLVKDHLANILPDNAPFIPYDGELKQDLIDVKRNIHDLKVEQVKPICENLCQEIDDLLKDTKFQNSTKVDFIINYLEIKMREALYKNDYHFVKEYRTFDNGVPKKDLEKFPALEKYKNEDISYVIWEELEIL